MACMHDVNPAHSNMPSYGKVQRSHERKGSQRSSRGLCIPDVSTLVMFCLRRTNRCMQQNLTIGETTKGQGL